jgi:hypothetical protein
MTYLTPADQGIEAARNDEAEKKHMVELLDKFKAFVLDSMSEHMHHDFDDHYDFLRAALECYEENEEV